MEKILVLVFCLSLLLAGCGQGSVVKDDTVNQNTESAPVNVNQQQVNANLNVNSNTPTSVPVVTGVTLSKLLISDVFDDQGTVSADKTTYSGTTPEIGVSVYILGAKIGLKVTAELIYLPSGDKVGPVNNDTQMEGDIISNFSFTKPTKGWPSGNYAVTATLEDGQTLTTNFNVP
ncbi:MAG: hypothetical protein NTX82_07025 [Candidatus Parcubacteria bacterium]|nr:hypothetical protein [Candidatus Parcubacteria bacterium]